MDRLAQTEEDRANERYNYNALYIIQPNWRKYV